LVIAEVERLAAAGDSPSKLEDIVAAVQRLDPSRRRGSIVPIVQGMTANAGKGPGSAASRGLLRRVGRGYYELTGAGAGRPSSPGSKAASAEVQPPREGRRPSRSADKPVARSEEKLTVDLLRRAHRVFEEEEPRNLFYRAATYLIERALEPSPRLSLAESLAVLLQTWNAQFYRFHGKFTHQRLGALQRVLDMNMGTLIVLRNQRLGAHDVDAASVAGLFTQFEGELGQVGAAKALHLLAPRYFPLWDQAIATRAYRLSLASPAAASYLKLMGIVRSEIKGCGGWTAFGEDENPVKLIDEWRYCTATLGVPIPG
jgi:hypothetical protein